MLNKRWVLLLTLISASAFADVSFEEKKNRVEYLEQLTDKAVSMNIEAYRRELQYEQQNLPLDKRAESEASLLAEKIRLQVQRAYEVALENNGADGAAEEIKNAIEKDLQLVAPELKEEIRKVAMTALEDAQFGGIGREAKLDKIEEALLKGIEERSAFLNEEAKYNIELTSKLLDPNLPSTSKNKDFERSEYSSKTQVLESLVSDRDNIRYVSTSNTTLKSAKQTSLDSKIRMQVKVSFLGIDLEAGPSITFKRQYATNVSIIADGLNPILSNDGNFDFFKRDNTGKVIIKAGKAQKRFIIFSCDSSLDFETQYNGSGGFSVGGIGGSTSVSQRYSNSVSLSSRRILVPESVEGKTVTYKFLQQLCHSEFLNARITNNMTVSDSLNIMMKNVISSLRFSHPKTKCAVDSHCYDWYNKELIGLSKIGNFPRCVEEKKEKFRTCELRGLKGQNCAVYDAKGKKLSDGMFEYTCDVGLKCVKVQNEGWFQNWEIYQYARGKCMPINARTYRGPLK